MNIVGKKHVTKLIYWLKFDYIYLKYKYTHVIQHIMWILWA